MRAYLIAGAELSLGGADAVVVDGRAAPASLRAADEAMKVAGRGKAQLFMRVDGIDAPGLDDGLCHAAALRPDAVVFPARAGRDIAHLGARLAVVEAEHGLPDGGIGIVALVTCAAGVLAAGGFAEVGGRLRGLGWDVEALTRQLGMDPERTGSPGWSPPLAQARAAIRLAAAAASVEAIEASYLGGDAEGFAVHVASARRDGFEAMFARDAAQTRLIRGGT